MTKYILAFLFCIIPWAVNAQTPLYKKTFRVAVEAVNGRDKKNNQFPAIKYSLLYSTKISTSRWQVEGGLSYINHTTREQFDAYNFYYNGSSSQRIMVDISFSYNLLRSNRHSFRIGGGPSVWYQKNGFVRNLSIGLTGQEVESITYTRVFKNEFNVGVNLRGDYEYEVTPKLALGARVGLIGNLLTPDAEASLPSSFMTAGLSIGYRF